MTAAKLPSLDISESVKRGFTEADVHSKLFEPDLVALGYPVRTTNQADGEYFLEQHKLALRRLKTGKQRGHYDGLYMVGNSPASVPASFLRQARSHTLLPARADG